MTTEKRNDEIDLIELFQKMANGIINLANKFLNLLYTIFLFFIRKSILMGVIIAIAIAFGYFQYKTSPRYYSSSIEAYSNAISSIDMINYVNNINQLFKNGNKEELQAQLKIDSSNLENIKNIKAFKVIDFNKDGITDLIDYDESFLTSDSIVSSKRFVVQVEVYDPLIFPVIQESILNYIDKNKYITKLNTIRKEQLNELITKLNSEISSLDSLKNVEYFDKTQELKPQAGQLLVMNEKTTQLYHEKIIDLYMQKQAYERSLRLNTDAITIIQDFSALSTVENDLISYLKKFGIIGLVLAIFISVVFENITGIKHIISDSKKK